VLLQSEKADEERIDASDPTKIYTFMGGGLKYNDYTNGGYMWDLTAEKNFDVDLRSFSRGPGEDLENDFNVFFNVTTYF
jgi:hypothetical protein